MDEKLVEEISSSTGVPQELVSRSAQARAEANGVISIIFYPVGLLERLLLLVHKLITKSQ